MNPVPREPAPLMLSVSGCRGITGSTMTPDVVRRYCGAFVAWIGRAQEKRRRIVVGRDGRAGGEPLAVSACGALRDAGCDVIDLGVAMTPTVGVMVIERRAAGGLAITASHNPGEWNGLKPITHEGRAPSPEDIARLNGLFSTGVLAPSATTRGTIESEGRAAQHHVTRVLKALSGVADLDAIRARRFRVVLDSVNASGAAPGRMLLELLGCVLTHLNAEPTGLFPHPPEPIEQNLTGLCDAAKQHAADVAFAQDPDGDRLAIVDERDRYIGEEYTLVLSTLSLLGSPVMQGRKGAVLVANMSTSRMIDDIAERLGARVERSLVGEANVAGAMALRGSVIGGEGNGGVIWPEVVMIRDSLSAMALVLALMTLEGRSLGSIVDGIPAYAIEKRKVPAAAGLVDRAASGLASAFPGAIVDRRDGIRLDMPAPSGRGKAWLHVRASNTEPIVRLIAEAPTRDDAARILDGAETRLKG